MVCSSSHYPVLRRTSPCAFWLCILLFVSLSGTYTASAIRNVSPENLSVPDSARPAENSAEIASSSASETASAFLIADLTGDGSALSGDGVDLSGKSTVAAEDAADMSPAGSAGTLVVSKDPGGDCSSIQEAIDNASAGDSIVVKSGIYRESLVVDKTLEIRSETGNSGDVAVSARDGLPVVAVSGDAAVGLSGLGLYRTGGNGAWTTVGASARLELNGVCIGWGYAKAGSIHIRYDAKGRATSSESAGFAP